MKKILFFISLLFAVVCYASPPPDEVSCYITDDVGCFVQDNQTVVVYTFEAQEVAFVDVGNMKLTTCRSEYFEQVYDVFLPQAMIIDLSFFRTSQLNKPPSFYRNEQVTNFQLNKQNSNYGYPLTGDNC